MTSKHDADQAGGAKVEVFTSDGAEAVDPVRFPSFPTTPDIDAAATMTAEQAFEVFAGKLLAVNPYKKKELIPTKESPLQRLTRIQQELEELQGESIMAEEVTKLQGQMQKLSLLQSKRQDYLTATIQSSMDRKVPSVETTPVANGVVVSPEARLQRLEQTSRSLAERLPALEDSLDVDALQKRAKVIRQDLEAAAKARNKLMAVSSGEDSKAIAALYDQLQHMQGISRHLPALVERLQELAHQHVNNGSQQTRFTAVENATNQLQQQVESIETSISGLEKLMETNAQAMRASVEHLQSRLEKLSGN